MVLIGALHINRNNTYDKILDKIRPFRQILLIYVFILHNCVWLLQTVLKAVKRINEVIPIIIKSSDVNDGSEPSAMQKIMGDSSLTYL